VKRLLGRLISRLLLVVVAVWLASVACVVLWGFRDSSGAADAIVVLGAAQYAGRPSPVLRSRLDHAHELWKRDVATRVILTGGRGDGDTTSEAEVGRVYLRRLGIPARSMLLETTGRSTEESLDAVAEMMRAEKLVRVILVSDPFHMFRLQVLSWRRGLDVRCSPTRTSPIAKNRTETTAHVLAESIKVIGSLVPVAWRFWPA
jgi:uncharacterized SAM-binding protein YcdF (DUF218 family)